MTDEPMNQMAGMRRYGAAQQTRSLRDQEADVFRRASDFRLPKSQIILQNQQFRPLAIAAFVVVHLLYRTEKELKVS